MRKYVSLLLFIACLPVMAQTTIADRPVAVVKLHKTEVIPQSKFEQYVQVIQNQNNGAQMTLENKKNILDIMINQILVKQDAQNNSIVINDSQVQQAAMEQLSMELQQAGMIPQGAVLNDINQFNQLLQQQGMNPSLYLENVKNNLIIQSYILQTHRNDFMAQGEPSEREVKSFYNSNIQMFAIPEYVQIRQIFFDLSEASDKAGVKNTARDLFRKLETGQEEFATALSTEGDLFPLNQERIQPLFIAQGDEESFKIFGEDFTNALFEGKDIGRPYLLESNIGMHIVVVDEWSEATIRTLDDTVSPVQTETVRDFIKQIVANQKQQQLYAQLQQQVVVDLREQAGDEGIRVFEEAIR